MTLCIPTDDQTGLQAAVSGHFGRAPYFALVDSESREVRFVENRDPSHESGHCIGAALAARNRPEVVLTSGMGRGAYDLLQKRGARIYRTAETTLAAAVDAFAAGQPEELLSPESAGHHHGHGRGECCGEGHHGRGRE